MPCRSHQYCKRTDAYRSCCADKFAYILCRGVDPHLGRGLTYSEVDAIKAFIKNSPVEACLIAAQIVLLMLKIFIPIPWIWVCLPALIAIGFSLIVLLLGLLLAALVAGGICLMVVLMFISGDDS